MYTYQVNITEKEHDDFVSSHKQANLLQSSSWARVKDNWGNARIGFYENKILKAVASILIQPLPLGFTLLYIPRGPIMDYTDKKLVAFVLKSLKEFGKTKRAIFIKFDPSLFLTRGLVTEEKSDSAETLEIITTLESLGCEWTGRTTSLDENIQPRFQANIYKEHFSAEQLSKSTKQAIRTALNKGVEISFGQTEFLDEFSDLMKKTEDRKSISLRGKNYYKKLLETYPEHSYITLAYLDLEKRQTSLLQQKTKLENEASKFTEKTKAGKITHNQQELDRITEELLFLDEKLKHGPKKVALAGTLSLEFAKTSENVYAGMDDEFRRYQPAIITWYETAKHAFERGALWQNMGGVENSLDGGLYNYKSKFNPIIEEFAGEFNLPVNTIFYRLTNSAYKIRKKLRSKN